MSNYDNELTGAIFPNDKHEKGDQRPHYTGKVTVGGVEYWVAGWKKRSKKGDPYMSLALTLATTQAERKGKPSSDESTDDIPF